MGFSIEGLRKYAEGDGGAVGLGFSGSQARTTTTFVTGGVEEKSKEDATFRDKPQPGQPGQPAGPAVSAETAGSSNTLVQDQPTGSSVNDGTPGRRRKRRWDNPQGQPSSGQDTCPTQHPATQEQELANAAPMHAETDHAQVTHPNNNLQAESSIIHDDIHTQVERIRNARLIATRLREEQPLVTGVDCSVNYAQQREDFLEMERQKFQSCRLKNLEYVMKREESEMQQHIECVNQISGLEEKQNIQIQIMREQQRRKQELLEQRKAQRQQTQMLNENAGGIGSKEQRRAETVRKRHHSEQRTSISNADTGESLRASLYLTNLPTDGSCDERILKSLFCLFGRLDRVTMYRDRSTGDLKGDGLISYGRDAALEHKSKGTGVDLVETVCSQVSLVWENRRLSQR